MLGDERYGHLPTNRYFEEKHGLDRTFLHLVRIEIQHPRTGVKLLVESTLPGDLRSAIERATGSSVLRFLEQKHALGDHRASSIPPPPAGGDDAGDGPPPSSRVSSLPDEMGDSMRPSLLPITDEGRAAPRSRRTAHSSIRPAIVSDDDAVTAAISMGPRAPQTPTSLRSVDRRWGRERPKPRPRFARSGFARIVAEMSHFPDDRPRILIVDDEKVIRDMLADFLGMEGYYVRTAEDGTTALTELTKSHFDLVISDLKMPKMGGIALLDEIGRTARPTLS